MTVYQVVQVSHIGTGDVHIALYVAEEDAKQKVRELEIIYAEDDCRSDYSFGIRERQLL